MKRSVKRNFNKKIRTVGSEVKRGFNSVFYVNDDDMNEDCESGSDEREDEAYDKAKFTRLILDQIKATVGTYPAETGGMLACSNDLTRIDTWRFDETSANTAGSYEYDVSVMDPQYREWKKNGITAVGFIHSHPFSYRQPSYSDVATAYALMKFFGNSFFYLPIVIPDREGKFYLYFFVVRDQGRTVNVNLDYAIRAKEKDYIVLSCKRWNNDYSVAELESFFGTSCERTDTGYVYDGGNSTQQAGQVQVFAPLTESAPAATVAAVPTVACVANVTAAPSAQTDFFEVNIAAVSAAQDNGAAEPEKAQEVVTSEVNTEVETTPETVSVAKDESNGAAICVDTSPYFQRLQGMYPDEVLNKVVVVIGTGGIRSYVENMARNGFRYFILVDGDKIAPSNIATQGVFISEMGKWKTEAIRDRVLDINPNAEVICINKFLDDDFADEEFADYLKKFPREKMTDYLVLGCCDVFKGNERAANLSLKYGIPYIGAAMYKEGLAAEVLFTYPGVTASCPRCMIEHRYSVYENGNYKNDVTSAGCTTFATERLNTLIGYVSLMLLMYGEAPDSAFNKMLDGVKDRNYVWIRLSPYLDTSVLGISFFNKIFADEKVSQFMFMDETVWIPQHPNGSEQGEKTCPLCGGAGNLRNLIGKWPDTRKLTVVKDD